MFSYSQRGAAHTGLKNFEQAVADYTRAIELDPTQPMADYTEAIRLDRELGNSSSNANLPWTLRGNQLPDRN